MRIVHESRDNTVPHARAEGGSLWLARPDVELATGWVWKPEGLCHGETCIPLPPRADPPIVDGDLLNVAALWRYLGWPVVHDTTSQLWVLGEGASRRADVLTSLHAPDFELPDLDGHLHRLSDYRGRRVLLATWASW